MSGGLILILLCVSAVTLALLGAWFFRVVAKGTQGTKGDSKDQLEIIEYFSKSVFRQNNTEDILWDITSSCIEKMGLEDCVIYLRDDAKHAWVQKAAYGPKNVDYRSIHEPIELAFGKGIVGRVGKTGVAEIVSDTAADPSYVVDDAVRGSEMAVPIFCDDEVIGVIDSEHTLRDFFQPHHMRIMQNVANICGQKIGRSMGEQRIAEFATFFELNPNPVARFATSGRVLLANKAARNAFGSECKEGAMLPRDHVLQPIISGHSEEEDGARHQIQMGSKWYQVTLSSSSANQHIELYAVDVTEVQEARDRASQAERHKSDFLSVMSHEIRTPLNAILGLIELLVREEVDAEDRLSHLSYMEFAGKHLQGLLTDVLDLERLDSGKASPHLTSFEPHELFKRVVNGFGNRAKATGNELSLEVSSDVPDVLTADVGWLTQIVNNLVANALKFTSDGRVSCDVSWRDGTLIAAVQDTGKGIAAEDLNRILEPFEQAKGGQLNVSNDGVGLGLAITKRLLDLHGGSLEVKSEVGKGSRFVISLPLEVGTLPDQSPRAEAREATSRVAIPDAPVLIVDDNELNVLVAQRMVSNWGYDVLTASNSDEAENHMETSNPFVVLMDIHMPGRDGFQTTRDWRRETCRWRSVPIIGLTADAGTHTRMEALESGMNDVVVKPFNPPHLRTILEHHAAQAE